MRARLPQLAADSVRAPTNAPAPTPAGLAFCDVVNVVDGDTIDVADCGQVTRVRLILIDTPEVSPGECFGKEASAFTTEQLLNRQVGLEKDITDKDFFGRSLRYVWIDGELYNERIVRQGFAALGIYPPDLKYRDRIAAAEQDAQTQGRGLWPACGGIGVPGTPTPRSSATLSVPPTNPPLHTPTPLPPSSGDCTAATAPITALNKVLEVVTVSGSGNLTGWYLISTRGQQRFDFPLNFTLSDSVQIKSGTPPFANSQGQLWWTAATQWNNSESDDAILYDCNGVQVSYLDDGD